MPILVLHCVLLPLNAFRLHQMLRLTRQVAAASRSDLNLDWLMPYGTRRRVRAGEVLFRKGDPADRMALVLAGGLRDPGARPRARPRRAGRRARPDRARP